MTRQKAARLVMDLAQVAKAESFVEVDHAHVSGVCNYRRAWPTHLPQGFEW